MTGSSVAAPRFDWYAATINVGVDTLRDVLCRDLGGASSVEDGPRNGYQNREVVRDADDRVVAVMLHGGNGDIPHAFASSDTAHNFAEIVRANWPDRHKVSRLDAALDYDGPGTWAKLLAVCEGIADGPDGKVQGDLRRRVSKIRTNFMGDWHHGEHGRTFGLGSFKSAVYVRLYEKGIQLREDAAKHGITRDDISTDAVRLEVQVRPASDSKRQAAKSTPLEVFGYAEWTKELLRRVENVDVMRTHIKERRDSDHERALQWMVKQYGSHLLQELMVHGSWAKVGESLGRRIDTAGPDVNDERTPF